MKEVTTDDATYDVGADEAMVIFMRPSGMGFAIQSTVFEVGPDGEEFIGVVPAKKKVIYRTKPGKHTFMVVGESADFMRAELEAGKKYYGVVIPRMGVWKARFSLGAVHHDIEPQKLKDWATGCSLVENTPDAYTWAERNANDIHKKHKSYYEKWQKKAEKDKPTLNPDDGF